MLISAQRLFLFLISFLFVVLFLSACGGGGNSGGGLGVGGTSNVIPVANAGANQTINENTAVTLDGSASSDSDGTIASYAWKQTAGTAVTLSDATAVKPTFTAPDVAADETLIFELTVTDDKGATGNSSINVTVSNINVGLRGKFIDAPVSGLKYQTNSRSGITDENGFFYYDSEGDDVYFSLGELEIGSIKATSEVHVYDLDNGSSNSDVNIRAAQVLQSLDQDKNPKNGIQLTSDISKKVDGKFSLGGTKAEFDSMLKQKLTYWEIDNYISYEDAKSHADEFAKELATKCPLADPVNSDGNVVSGLSCVDKARFRYFQVRIKPWLHQQVNGNSAEIKVIADGYTDEAVRKAIDVNPIVSALKAIDETIDTAEKIKKGQSVQAMANAVKALTQAIQVWINFNVAWESVSNGGDPYSKDAEDAEKNFKLLNNIISTFTNVPACTKFLTDEAEEGTSCIAAIESGMSAIVETPGMDFKIKGNVTSKEAVKLLVNELKAVRSLIKLVSAADGKKIKALFGFAGSIVKVSRSAVSLAYASEGEKEPVAGESGYFILSMLDNAITPSLNIAKECYGSGGASSLDKAKCYSKIAQEVGTQATRVVVGVIGNIHMMATIDDLNEAIVTDKVIEELLLAGAANHKSVYDKYAISYADSEFLRRGNLINAIGEKLGYTGVWDFNLGKRGLVSFVVKNGMVLAQRVRSDAFSIEDVRESVAFNYARIMNETPIEFDLPSITLVDSKGDRGQVFVDVTVELTKLPTKSATLVCYSDDNSSLPINAPWSANIDVSNLSHKFEIKYPFSGRFGVMCNFFSATSLYLGSKSIPVVVDGYDSDNDKILDTWEIQHGLDPNNPADAAQDKDGDGLSNLDEYNHKTDPTKTDTDGDDYTDKQEVDAGSDPLDKTKYPAPPTPQNVRAVPGDRTVTLTWDASPGANRYLVCQSLSSLIPSGGCVGERGEETTSLSKVFTDLNNGTPYYFYVVALNAGGQQSSGDNEIISTPQQTSTGVLFRDDFDILNKDLWTVVRVGGNWRSSTPDYGAVSVSGGKISLLTDRTDDGPIMYSRVLKPKAGQLVRIKWRNYIHPANRYFSGAINIFASSNKDLSTDIALDKYLCSVTHRDYTYGGNWNEFSLDGAQERVALTPYWNQWVEEEFTYDPSNGYATYTVNGETVTTTCRLPDAASPYLRLRIHSYGWWTGHYTDMDYIEVSGADYASGSNGTTGKLNDTGITLCGDYAYGHSNNHSNNVSCALQTDADGDPIPQGQDGTSGRDVTANDDSDGHAGFSFTKISSTGAELPASATEWSCVKDNVTGLMWEVKTNNLHNKSWTYSWYEPDSTKNGGSVGYQNGGACGGTSRCDTTGFVQAVNSVGWCGYKDWRMPTKQELRSIVNYYNSPAIDVAYFPDMPWPSLLFWSSSPVAYSSGYATLVNFDDGRDNSSVGWGAYHIRLVHDGK